MASGSTFASLATGRISNACFFRDWLRAHGEEAAEYAALKRRLASEAPADWKAYGDGKSEFVARIVARASRGEPAAGTLTPPASTSAR